MTDQEILDNAPEGATHYQVSSGSYYMLEGSRMYAWLGEVWSVQIANDLEVLIVGDVSPLSYIKASIDRDERIAELENKLKIASAVYEQIIKEQRDTICLFMPDSKRAIDNLKIRDLEQQAKGLTDYAKNNCSGIDAVWLIAAASKLREQAKGGDL